MKIADSTAEYLKGEKFSTGFIPEFITESADRDYVSRLDILASLCAGKRILHIGCVDHAPEVVVQKLAKGKWLHKILTESCSVCLGVDISEDGIRYLHESGWSNVMHADITRPPAEILDHDWDYIVIPEVLEHIGNPVAFLEGIRSAMQGRATAVIITVPNAFALGNFRMARNGRERINSDHRFWFTPYTLAKVVTDSGFKIDRIYLCKGGKIHRGSFLRNAYFRRKPMLRNNIIMTAGF